MIPEVPSEKIFEALDRFDREYRDAAEWIGWEHNAKYDYALRSSGKLYPVKFIVSLATGAPRDSFSGGEGVGAANSYLRRRGFEVIGLIEGDESMTQGRRYWIEKTKVRGRTDREEGPHSLGRALWSPQRSEDGRDIYQGLRDAEPGDVVIHLVDNERIAGVSLVAARVDESFVGLESTDWAGRPGYRVALRDYTKLTPPLPRDNFLRTAPFDAELRRIYGNRTSMLFYSKDLALNQGAYLTEAPRELVNLLNQAYLSYAHKPLPHVGDVIEPFVRSAELPQALTMPNNGELFLEPAELTRIVALLRTRKNVILQGPPGTGKTFIARRIASMVATGNDPKRIQMVQFHQSYSYEDFIQGYRPTEAGGFILRDGVFYQFCEEARAKADSSFVFLIDEINRGNLSKVFGELMLLIEPDKRGSRWAMPLAYHRDNDPPFYVPANVYLLGMMNTADRSLAVVDYALRRRFAFVNLAPQFNRPAFRDHLLRFGVSGILADKIISRLTRLNGEIANDTANLGPGFEIGHSYFCPTDGAAPDESWYREVVEAQIGPLLREYYFDNREKAEAQITALLA